MGQNSAKVFNPPQSYGQANVSQISEVTPQGINAPTTLLPDQAGAGVGVNAPAAPAASAPRGPAQLRKFFGDMELDNGPVHPKKKTPYPPGPMPPSFPPRPNIY